MAGIVEDVDHVVKDARSPHVAARCGTRTGSCFSRLDDAGQPPTVTPSCPEDHACPCRRHDELLWHLAMDSVDRVNTRAVHGKDVVGVEILQGRDGLGHYLIRGGGEMETADDRVNFLDAGSLLELTDRIDHASMAARRDDNEAAVLYVIASGVFALKGIGHQVARFHFDLRHTKMGR